MPKVGGRSDIGTKVLFFVSCLWKSSTYLWERYDKWALEPPESLPHPYELGSPFMPSSRKIDRWPGEGGLGRAKRIDTCCVLRTVSPEFTRARVSCVAGSSSCVGCSLSSTHISLCLICGKLGGLNWDFLKFHRGFAFAVAKNWIC